MENLKHKTLRQTLREPWSRYVLMMFSRISQPYPQVQPRILKQIKLFKLTLNIENDRENYLQYVDELIASEYEEMWIAAYVDLRHHSESYREFLILTRRFQQELIIDIQASREWNEFRRYVNEEIHDL